MFKISTATAQSSYGRCLLGVVMLLTVTAGCGIIRHRTSARCEPGLPCYDGYGQKSTLGRVPALTFTGIRLVEQPVPQDVLARVAAPPPVGRDALSKSQKRELSAIVQNAVTKVLMGQDEPTPAEAGPTPDPISTNVPPTVEVTAADVAVAGSQSQPVAAPPPVRVRYFALANDALQVDHCRLSQVSFILWSDGRWEMFVRAEQNPERALEGMPAGTAVAARPQRKQTSHIKRNEFHVVAKGFAGSQAADPVQGDRVAKPVLLHRSMNPFWVERGQPKELTFHGNLDAKQDFDLIKRFEVEFAYR